MFTDQPILEIEMVEEYYGDLESETNHDLIIPNAFPLYNFGAKAFFCQFLNTWVRRTKNANVILNLPADSDLNSLLQKFTDQDYGFILTLMTIKQKRRFYDKNKNDITKEIRDHAL